MNEYFLNVEDVMEIGGMKKGANIPLGTYSNILNKKSASPKTVGKLAKALDTDVLNIIVQPTEKQDE
ncbi:hypothetical protein [Pseudoramibacter porci]|uniref:HTH cro/C1-type domain-containing protein n=1 Tax=Pseudoramibacter porci TaxID=2606631 RepID=A0A7X2T940_9FIRM|nr:hypothetical protein [Pseudoramibacter porci]MSS19149.1 hypothetical protein [Pseudoramibacter porci]